VTTTVDGDTNGARVLDRAQQALEAYRVHGTWDKAAEVAGYTNRGSAYRAAMVLLSRRVDVTASLLREEANARHAQKLAMLEDVIYDLDRPLPDRLRAVDAHTKAEARHARLNGLDAPLQVALSAGVSADLDDALAEAEELFQVVAGEVTARTDEPAED
jgi:hypothetical protein